jgi:PadR family transcriptional regulator AphA
VEKRLTTNDLTVLALIGERQTHGWAVAGKLARGGEVGQIWAVSRPIVYHALEKLERAGLVQAIGLERGGRGPHRVIYAVTDEGRRELDAWLERPVEHVRDIRSVFLLKIVLTERGGRDPEALLLAQRAALLPLIALLEAQADETGPELPGETTVAAFRLETATAIVHFIDRMLEQRQGSPAQVMHVLVAANTSPDLGSLGNPG